jgi:hypothetical protein
MGGNDPDRNVAGAPPLGIRTILISNSPYYDPARRTNARIAATLADVPNIVMALDAADERGDGAQ